MQLEQPQLDKPKINGLVLTGGGARAAYQVGVLKALSEIHRHSGQDRRANPFPVITGTSAGAINASALACGADDFWGAVERLVTVWHDFRADQVYRADALGVARSGARWLGLMSMGWAIARWRRARPRSLLDNTPLRELLETMVPLQRIAPLVDGGHLRALAISASSYTSGQHVTFFQGEPTLEPWVRSQRHAVASPITYDHLLASSAIPFVFPSMALRVPDGMQYFGDGSMRQVSPLSPAVHLGASRVLVIGVGQPQRPGLAGDQPAGEPNLAAVAGHTLASVFHDTVQADVEHAQRVTRTVRQLPRELAARLHFRPVDVMLVQPSRSLDAIARSHARTLPLHVRRALGGLGVGRNGGAMASYLLFEPAFVQELMALGEQDAYARKAELLSFFENSEFAYAS